MDPNTAGWALVVALFLPLAGAGLLTLIPARLDAEIRRLQAQGVRHFAWYPDDFIAGRPSTYDARAAMSARSFPYEEK